MDDSFGLTFTTNVEISASSEGILYDCFANVLTIYEKVTKDPSYMVTLSSIASPVV